MIKVQDIAFVRFASPDLDTMETFARDFGLTVTSRGEESLYLRGTDPSPYCHVTRLGEPGFEGMAFEAASADDLRTAARLEGASGVEKLDGPGGGEVVRFRDPDGFSVEVVHGREPLPKLEVTAAAPLNTGSRRRRRGELQRVPRGPSQVKRLGHVVLKTKDYRVSEAWYKSRFGFLTSDEVYLGDPSNVVTAFLRCDRGAEYTDHHTLLCVGLGQVGFDHAAFEIEDFDALMTGHDVLEAAGYEHVAGVGRHILGSQIFDYWKDPWGHTMEHFTDGDLLNVDHPTGQWDPGVALGTQWGDGPRPS